MKRRDKKNQKGFTLIEVCIVLGVFAIIIAAVWLVVGVVYENVRQYQTNQQMQLTVQNVRQLLTRITRFTSSTGTDITATLDQQTAFPVQMRINEGTANGNLNHPWSTGGGAVNVLVRGATEFGIRLQRLPRKPCTTVLAKLSSGELAGLTGIQVNGGTVITGSDLPINLVTADTLCTSAASNTVEWRFALRPQ